MKKKIFITENQYKRIFLKEVGSNDPKPLWNPHIRMWTHPAYSDYEFNVPKNMIYKKNSNGTFSPAYPYSSYENTEVRLGGSNSISKDDPDIIKKTMEIEDEKFFKKHIKNKSDSDAFRLWANDIEFPDRIKKVNTVLKQNGLKGSLDTKSSAPYDNIYMKVAFKSIGRFYVIDLDKEVKVKQEELKIASEDIKNFIEYKNYSDALKNWDSVSKSFGWSGVKTVSSEDITNIIEGKVKVSSCINPSYVLTKMVLLRNEMIFNLISQNKMSYDDANNLLVRRTFDERLKNYFTDIEPKPPMKLLDIETPSLFDDSGKQYIDYTGGLGHTYFRRLELAKTSQIKNEKSYEKSKQNYQNNLKLKAELDNLGTTFKENLKDYNTYDAILEKINIHNITIINQTPEKLENACENPVYNIKSLNVGYAAPGSGGSSGSVNETFTWKQACSKNGGVFMYPSQPVSEEGGTKKIGFIGGKVTCCCVNPKGTADVTVNGLDGDYNAKINIEEWCNKSQGDVRSGLDKFAQWGADCVSDWHCIADIASIAVLALGPGGILLSGIIDAVSAVGYVAEQDEGWELNAGLTILGSFGGVGEAFGLLKQGSKFTTKLSKLTTELKLVSGDPILSRRILRDFAKTLSPEEAKQFKNFGKVSTSESVISKFGKGGEFTNEFNKLSKIQKGVFSDMLKKESPENLEKLFKNSGNDINKMVDGYVKGTKQVIFQGGLFAGMYVYSDELGLFLKDIYDKYGFDPLGIFDSNGNLNLENEKLKNIDFNRIKSKKEIVKYFKPEGSNSEFKSKFTEVSAKYSEIYLLSLKKLIDYKEEQDLLIKFDSILKNYVDGIGLNLEKYSQCLYIGINAYNKIFQSTLPNGEIKKILNEGIITINSLPKNKINNDTKSAVIITNNPYIDKGITIMDLLEEPTEEENKNSELTPNNSPNETDEGMKKLNEEIKRIKSLFSEERLYGNLINEQFATDTNGDGNIDEPEAVSFLRSKGYILKSKTEDDMCLGPNTSLKSIYENYKNENVGFELWNSKIGCAMTIYRKNKIPGNFYKLNIFEGSGGNRFALYYEVGKVNCCETEINPGNLKFNAGVENYDSSTYTWGVGLNYIKIEGFWEPSGTDFTLKDMVIVNLLKSNYNDISPKISGGIIPTPVDIGFRSNNPAQLMELMWMKDSTGNCIKIKDFISQEMGGTYTTVFGLDDIINLLN
jgi:hypothetical protein